MKKLNLLCRKFGESQDFILCKYVIPYVLSFFAKLSVKVMYKLKRSESVKSCSLFDSYYHLLELSSDLKRLFENRVCCDFILHVGTRDIPCHKAILCARSKWFSYRIDEVVADGLNSITLEENENLVDALLMYIYTGSTNLMESLKIPLLDLVCTITKFGLRRFNKLLFSMIKSSSIYERTKTVEFPWKIKVDDCKSTETVCPALKDVRLDDTHEWCLKMRPTCLLDTSYAFRIFLIRKLRNDLDACDVIHVVNLEINILDIRGKQQRTFYMNYVYRKDGQYKMPDYISLNKLQEKSDLLLPGGILTLSCKLTTCSENAHSTNRVIFELSGHLERSRTNELHALSRDMYEMLKSGKFCDSNIHVKRFPPVKVHSYILYCRSRIPSVILCELDDVAGFGSIAWRSFINFLYSGQARFLEDHMRVVYCAANELKLDETKKKYSNILIYSLTVSNAYGILTDASLHRDKNLISEAMIFIVRNSSEIVKHPSWNSFVSEYPTLSRDVMKSAGCKKSLLAVQPK